MNSQVIIQATEGISEAEEAERRAAYALYELDPKVKKLADEIHNSRMMPPPCCYHCIQIAISRLEAEGYSGAR